MTIVIAFYSGHSTECFKCKYFTVGVSHFFQSISVAFWTTSKIAPPWHGQLSNVELTSHILCLYKHNHTMTEFRHRLQVVDSERFVLLFCPSTCFVGQQNGAMVEIASRVGCVYHAAGQTTGGRCRGADIHIFVVRFQVAVERNSFELGTLQACLG